MPGGMIFPARTERNGVMKTSLTSETNNVVIIMHTLHWRCGYVDLNLYDL